MICNVLPPFSKGLTPHFIITSKIVSGCCFVIHIHMMFLTAESHMNFALIAMTSFYNCTFSRNLLGYDFKYCLRMQNESIAIIIVKPSVLTYS